MVVFSVVLVYATQVTLLANVRLFPTVEVPCNTGTFSEYLLCTIQ